MSRREMLLLHVLGVVVVGSFMFQVHVRWWPDYVLHYNEWLQSESGRHVICGHDFYRLQKSALWGLDLGCSNEQVLRYYETGGGGYDPTAIVLCAQRRDELEARYGRMPKCGG